MKMELKFDAQEVKEALVSKLSGEERIILQSHQLEITLNKDGAVLKTKEKPKRAGKRGPRKKP